MATELSLDELVTTANNLMRKNGRMEFAKEIAEWGVANRDKLPPELRESLAELIVKAGA